MDNNDDNPNKGNESERKEEQNQSTEKTIKDISPADVFGAPSPTETDGIISHSGKFVLWQNEQGNIYVEKRDCEPIPPRQLNYIQRLKSRGIARNVFQESQSRVEICINKWLIADKRETGAETNEVGDAEDLLPIVAEAL